MAARVVFKDANNVDEPVETAQVKYAGRVVRCADRGLAGWRNQGYRTIILALLWLRFVYDRNSVPIMLFLTHAAKQFVWMRVPFRHSRIERITHSSAVSACAVRRNARQKRSVIAAAKCS